MARRELLCRQDDDKKPEVKIKIKTNLLNVGLPLNIADYSRDHKVVVTVIVWWLDLQLPMQSVPITIGVVGSTPAHGEAYNIM